jgi:hypothetical protein
MTANDGDPAIEIDVRRGVGPWEVALQRSEMNAGISRTPINERTRRERTAVLDMIIG